MRSFAELMTAAQQRGPRTLAVAAAADADVLAAVDQAAAAGLVRAHLVGDPDAIRREAAVAGLDLSTHQVVPAADPGAAARTAVDLVRRGECDLLMKGMLQTGPLLRAVLDPDTGLRQDRLLSHVMALAVPTYPRLLFLADTVLNVAPDLQQKTGILANALAVMRRLAIAEPRVAVLGFVEDVQPGVQTAVDAAALAKMADRGQFGPCKVDGPLAFDLAVSPEAARHKGVNGPVAGAADLILCPDLNTGNSLYKALVYLAGAKVAGVVVGARAPVVLISRADTAENKLYSIALGLLAGAS